jgi:hypothetical protein
MKNPFLPAATKSLPFVISSFLGVSMVVALFGQDAAPLAKPVAPIPKGSYQTWSLFLVNNPQWLVPESGKKITSLYDQFEAFGRAIGPHHVAVWFWSSSVGGDARTRVDVTRSATFCERLNLPPSGGPYILVTNTYPGEGRVGLQDTFLPVPLKSYCTVSLNNKSADEIMGLLTRLADKVTSDRLSELNSRSESYWSKWQTAFEGLRDFLSNRQMTVTIKTPLSEVQIK